MSDVSTRLAEILTTAQHTAKRAMVHVDWANDPNVPGRTAYRLSGARCDAVQMHIADMMREAKQKGGMAEFTPPVRGTDNNFISLGHVIIGNPGELSRRLAALGARS